MSKKYLSIFLMLAVFLSSIASIVYADQPTEQTVRIEAESFVKTRAFPESQATTRGFTIGPLPSPETGERIGSVDALEWSSYTNVDLGAGYRKLRIRLATAASFPPSAKMELWLDATEQLYGTTDGTISGGTFIGSFTPANTGGYNNYQVQEFEIDPDISKGTHTLYFLLRANADAKGVMNVDYFEFADPVEGFVIGHGATVPFTTYEAEEATLGPGAVAEDDDLTRVSSKRRSVKLDATGEYVEFKNVVSANRLTLRYSIPKGSSGTISLYLNGQHNRDISLTSTQCYDSDNPDYPRTYDEISVAVNIPAGATVKLQKDSGDTCSWYRIDLIDLETAPPPLTMPSGYLSITSYGATPNDSTDDTSAIHACIAAAAQQGKHVWIPEGFFILNRRAHIPAYMNVKGAGIWYSQLHSTVNIANATYQNNIGFSLEHHSTISDIKFTGSGTARKRSQIVIRPNGHDNVIENIWVQNAGCAWGWTGTLPNQQEDPSFADYNNIFRNSRVIGTYFDGTHWGDGQSWNDLIENCFFRGLGDDAIACINQSHRSLNHDNVARFNTIIASYKGRGIAIVGGDNFTATDNYIDSTYNAGILLQAENMTTPTRAINNAVFERNWVTRCSHSANNHGSIHIAMGNIAPIKNVVFRNNLIENSFTTGLRIQSGTKGDSEGRTLIEGNIFRNNAQGNYRNDTNGAINPILKNNIGIAETPEPTPTPTPGPNPEGNVATFFTPVIDGKVDRVWENSSVLHMDEVNGFTGRARVAWDYDNLYYLFEITDTTPFAEFEKEHNDSVEVWVDELNAEHGAMGEGDYHLRVDINNVKTTNNKPESGFDVEAVRSVVTTGDGIYTVEIAVPFTALRPKEGDIIGLNVSANDDSDGDGRRNSYINWVDRNMPYWSDTSVYYKVELVGPAVPVARFGSPVIDGQIDDLWEASDILHMDEVNGFTGRARVAWDNENLYYLFEITDTTPNAKFEKEHNDSVEIWVDELNLESGPRNVDEGSYQLRIDVNNNKTSNDGDKFDVSKVTSAIVTGDAFYIIEFAVPYTKLTPAPGAVIGLNVSANDDSDGDGRRNSYVSWVDRNKSYWGDTSDYDKVILMAADSVIDPIAARFDKKAANQADVAVTMILNGNTLRGIYNGSYELAEGTDYTVSGNNVTIKKEYLATLPAGTVILTFDFSAGADQELVITIVDTTPGEPQDPEPETGSGSTATPTPQNEVKDGYVKIRQTVYNPVSGEAKASLPATDLDNALKNVKADEKGIKLVSVEIPGVTGARSYEVELPKTAVASGNTLQKVEVRTEFATVVLPSNMFDALDGNKLSLNVGMADTSTLSAFVKAQIGNRPVIDLSIEVDGKVMAWSNPKAPVKVSIPYTPSEAELADPEHIVVWYIDGEGNVIPVPTGRYDAATGLVTFTVTNFSKYAVVYVVKTFADISHYTWARKQIEILASKGVIAGTSEKTYSPEANIKRADFILLIVKALGLNADVEDNFDDVKPDAYYAQAVGIARKLGIAAGVGNNKFNPEEYITRQDMMVLLLRAMQTAGMELTPGSESDLDRFADKSETSSYATESIAALVRNGLVVGSGDKLNPRDNTTRAEAAVIIYKAYNK